MADLQGRIGPPSPDQAGADLDTRLTGNISQNQAALGALQTSETPSGLDMLLRPENLAKLGLAAAGALSGDEDLQALAAGLGLGTLTGAGQQSQDIAAQRQTEIDKLMALVDKQQQRMVTLLQSQPGLFLDAAGEPVKGATPGELASLTGTGVEFSPAGMNNRAEQTANKEKIWKLHGMLFESAMAAGDEPNAAAALGQMFTSVGMPTSAEEASTLLALPLENVPAVLAQRADVSSVVDVMVWSEQNQKPWWDPDAPKLRPKIDVTGGISGEMVARADQGIAKIVETMERLRAGTEVQQAQYAEYVNLPHTQIEILNAHPGMLNAVKKVYTATKQGDEIMIQSLKFLTQAMSDPNSIEALTTVLRKGAPEDRADAVAQYFRSLYGQTGMALGTIALETDTRRLATMTTEEMRAELARRKAAKEVQ